MPIYEFHCSKCERDSEILVRTTEWEGSECPHCRSTELVKKLSVFASAGHDSDAGPTSGGSASMGGCCGGGGCGCH